MLFIYYSINISINIKYCYFVRYQLLSFCVWRDQIFCWWHLLGGGVEFWIHHTEEPLISSCEVAEVEQQTVLSSIAMVMILWMASTWKNFCSRPLQLSIKNVTHLTTELSGGPELQTQGRATDLKPFRVPNGSTIFCEFIMLLLWIHCKPTA